MRKLFSNSGQFERQMSPPPRGELASRRYLQSWGLEEKLTEKDDSELWAAALWEHWPAPDEPNLNVSTLRFTVAEFTYVENPLMEKHLERRPRKLEVWRYVFVADEKEGVRAVDPTDTLDGTEFDKALEHSELYPQRALVIQSPSEKGWPALVRFDSQTGPLEGCGAAYFWKYRQREGVWKKTKSQRGVVRRS